MVGDAAEGRDWWWRQGIDLAVDGRTQGTDPTGTPKQGCAGSVPVPITPRRRRSRLRIR